MTITLYVITNASRERVEKTGEREYKVWVKKKAVDGKANEALIETLSRHFGVHRGLISISKGHKAKKKIVLIKSLAP